MFGSCGPFSGGRQVTNGDGAKLAVDDIAPTATYSFSDQLETLRRLDYPAGAKSLTATGTISPLAT